MTKRRPGDYEVGYCKPPAHGKIKPGERRNPSGRPPHPRAPDDIARKFLSEKIPIIDRGKRRYVSRYEVNLRNLFQASLKGNTRAALEIHQIGDQLGLNIGPAQDTTILVEFAKPDGKGGMEIVHIPLRELQKRTNFEDDS